MKQVHIVFTIAGLTPESGGPSRSVPALCEALADQGVTVELISLDYGPKYGAPLLPDPAKLHTQLVRCRGSRRIPALWTLRLSRELRLRAQASPDVILHDTGAWLPSNHVASRVARQTKRPLVISSRGMLSEWALNYQAGRKALAWRLYARSDFESARLLHVTSPEESEELRKLNLRQPIAILPNGIDVPVLSPVSRSTDDNRTILFLSRIHPKKGLDLLLEAWSRLKPERWTLIVAGRGEPAHEKHARDIVETYGIADRVRFVGEVDGPAKWQLYQSADLFVLPTFSENFGIVIAEALGCGTPVITTKAAPWSDLVTNRCGWWIDVGAEPLVAALREALSLSDEERLGMGQRGRHLAESKYSWQEVGRQMADVYRWLLGHGSRPACVRD